MKSAGYDVRESDPFAEQPYVPAIVTGLPPIVARLNVIWESQRAAPDQAVQPDQLRLIGR